MAIHLQHELDLACKTVQLCAVLTDRVQKESLGSNTTIKKWDYSPVTICDFAVQALLTFVINGAFQDDSFLAEESADELRRDEVLLDQVWGLIRSVDPDFARAGFSTPSSREQVLDMIDYGGKNQKSDGRRTWVFDPIDGTATFLRGQQYAINCAFLVNGIEQIGVIGCPNVKTDATTVHEDEVDTDRLGTMVFAVRGGGTWQRPMQHGNELVTARRIERFVSDDATITELTWTDCSTYTSTIVHLQQRVAAQLQTPWPGVDLYSSLMKYAALGLARADVCMRIFKYGSWKSNMWDHAGGVLIYEEAGGRVTDLDGKDIDFSTGRKMSGNNGLVCAPADVHLKVLEVVQQVLKDYGPIPWSKESFLPS